MLTVLICYFLALAAALHIDVSPLELHIALDFSGRASLLAIINYHHGPTVYNFGRILSCESLPLGAYYGLFHMRESPRLGALVDDLMANVFPDQSLHPYYFPLCHVQENTRLRRAIMEQLDHYKPGVIALGDSASQIFGEAELFSLTSRVSANPALLGSYQTGSLAWRYRFPRGWELDNSLTEDNVLRKIKEGHDVDLIFIGKAQQVREPILKSLQKFHTCKKLQLAMVKLLGSQDYLEGYNELLSLIREKIPDIDQSGRALWHGRLLINLMDLHPTHVELIQQLAIEYFTCYQAEDIPPYILEKVVEQISSSERRHFPAELPPNYFAILSLLDSRLPRSIGFWGGIDVYARHFTLALAGGRILAPPLRSCTLIEAAAFFAKGELDNTSPVLFNPRLMHTFSILPHAGRQVDCNDIVCVLETLTMMILEEPRLFIRTKDRFNISDKGSFPPMLCIFAARLMIYNLIFRKTVGFRLTHEFWNEALRIRTQGGAMVRQEQTPRRPINYIASQLSAVDFRRYFPIHVLLEDKQTSIKTH